LKNEIHLTLTEWKPIPYIFPIRTGRQLSLYPLIIELNRRPEVALKLRDLYVSHTLGDVWDWKT
jgi:hypothetical protein